MYRKTIGKSSGIIFLLGLETHTQGNSIHPLWELHTHNGNIGNTYEVLNNIFAPPVAFFLMMIYN